MGNTRTFIKVEGNTSTGIGSSLHDLQDDLLINLVISFAVVGRNADRREEMPQGSSRYIDVCVSIMAIKITSYTGNFVSEIVSETIK